MKPPAYFSKYNDKQKQEFSTMVAKGTNKNDIRSFLKACQKQFNDDYQIVKCGVVTHNDKTFAYSSDTGNWYPLG